jgi:hypothetical protein
MKNETIRPPAVAGTFYPGLPDTLRQDIQRYLDAATPPALENVRAVLAPHAGYMYSGGVAAFAYKLLTRQPTPPRRVYVMGPAHRIPFHGVAMTGYSAFKTPLGNYPLDTTQIARLAESGGVFNTQNTPHGPEHCLEVQVPFLQTVCPAAQLVPMLFGQVNPITVGQQLDALLEPDDLIVVSSDLSHFYSNEKAHTLDRRFLDALLRGDPRGVAEGEACGQAPALALMTIAAARGWQAHLLDYRTSGDVTGSIWEVVGYGAVAYTE